MQGIVEEWVEFLRTEKLWSNDDPLFPATEVSQGNNQQFRASGLTGMHWSTASPIREIFRKAFEQAGLPYFHPHTFRRTLALLGERMCRTPEEFKAWSQNLGHEKVLTTFSSYGQVATARQAAIIRGFGQPDTNSSEMLELAKQLVEAAKRSETASGRVG